MKLIKNLPKKLFKSKKSPSISRSNNPSFGSGSSSSSSSSSSSAINQHNGSSTPTTVLPEIPAANSAEIYAELLHAFHMLDTNSDGKITKEALETILTRIGSGSEPNSKEEVELLLNEINVVDEDRSIILEEFEAITSAFGLPACDEEMRDTFDFFDVNHDGKITAEELFNVFKMIGDGRCTLEECKRMIRGVDKNGDGFVCFEDFCLMMEQQRC